jgi:hypothetical protein
VRIEPEQVLEQDRVSSKRRVEDADLKDGSRNQVNPGARIRWMVAMKFNPVSIEENPAMKMPSAVAVT